MFRFFAGALGLMLVAAQAFAAEQPTPAFMQKDVLKAALEIGLTEEQQPKFRDGVTNFMNCRIAAFNRLMKGRDQVDMERKMKSKTKGCAKGMNKAMGEFLTDEQMPKYDHYRDTLIANMKGMG